MIQDLPKFDARYFILLDPPKPKPLHLLSDRLLGDTQAWLMRFEQVKNDNHGHCYACGGKDGNTEHVRHSFVEYISKDTERIIIAKPIETTALCKSCKSFINTETLIHSVKTNNFPVIVAWGILSVGFANVKKANAGKNWHAMQYALELRKAYPKHAPKWSEALEKAIAGADIPTSDLGDWSNWYMQLGNSVYASRFANISEWKEYFLGGL